MPLPRPHSTYTAPHPRSTTLRLLLHSGWGNVGYHRKHSSPSPEVVTPRLDELVATGIELDRL